MIEESTDDQPANTREGQSIFSSYVTQKAAQNIIEKIKKLKLAFYQDVIRELEEIILFKNTSNFEQAISKITSTLDVNILEEGSFIQLL